MIRFIQPPRHILLACQPKSGSTFLSNAIGNLPGFRNGHYVPGYDRREQELEARHIRKYRFRGYRAIIAQHHVRYSLPTARLIKRFNIVPVVLVRNFFDTIISIRDHLNDDVTTSPMAFFDESHAALPDHELEQAIARLEIPWYINFYMTWRRADGVLMINYDDMVADPERTVHRILNHAGLDANDKAISRALTKARGGRSRFNKGVPGRGATLTHETRQLVLDCLQYYPEARNDPLIAALYDAP